MILIRAKNMSRCLLSLSHGLFITILTSYLIENEDKSSHENLMKMENIVVLDKKFNTSLYSHYSVQIDVKCCFGNETYQNLSLSCSQYQFTYVRHHKWNMSNKIQITNLIEAAQGYQMDNKIKHDL